MEILIIGTEPPCVRCGRVFELVREVADEMEGEGVMVRKISYESEEAKHYGKVGTAHDIAEWASVPIDIDKLTKMAGVWSEELEKELMPYKDKAEALGYLMTPVLAINGRLKVIGVVPSKNEIRELIRQEREG